MPSLLEKYKQLLPGLMPKGRLWQIKDQPNLKALLDSFANELCRVEERANDLLDEADPRNADELISDWERLLGLPDECTPDDLDIAERRTQLLQKYTNIGGLSKEFYEFLGSQLGYTIVVENRVTFLVGRGTVGQPLTNDFDNPLTVGEPIEQQLRVYGWQFYFNAQLPIDAAEIFEVGDNTVGEPLVDYSNELMECTIKKLKPANSGVTFTFV